MDEITKGVTKMGGKMNLLNELWVMSVIRGIPELQMGGRNGVS